jgi:hypothetical protein
MSKNEFEVNLSKNEKEQIIALTDTPEYDGYMMMLTKMLSRERSKCCKEGISERDADVHRGQAKRLEKLIDVRESLLKCR